MKPRVAVSAESLAGDTLSDKELHGSVEFGIKGDQDDSNSQSSSRIIHDKVRIYGWMLGAYR